MSEYKRHYKYGGYYFFTVVTYKRMPIFTNNETVEKLKLAIKKVKSEYPFNLQAIVILPDHLHCLWQLPAQLANFSIRWQLIKRHFSMEFNTEINHRNEKNIWQRRFWEHSIRDEEDWQKHWDYIHYNPVKHGYVKSPGEWQYSSFQYWVNKGYYENDWGMSEPVALRKMEFE